MIRTFYTSSLTSNGRWVAAIASFGTNAALLTAVAMSISGAA